MDPLKMFIEEAGRYAKRARVLAFGRIPTDGEPALPSTEIARLEKIVEALDTASQKLDAAKEACTEDMTVNQEATA